LIKKTKHNIYIPNDCLKKKQLVSGEDTTRSMIVTLTVEVDSHDGMLLIKGEGQILLLELFFKTLTENLHPLLFVSSFVGQVAFAVFGAGMIDNDTFQNLLSTNSERVDNIERTGRELILALFKERVGIIFINIEVHNSVRTECITGIVRKFFNLARETGADWGTLGRETI